MFTHIDCFAGPGGICTGMHAAGLDTAVAIEYIQTCCETYAANHPEVHVIHSDIRKVQKNDVLPYIPKEGVDLVTSGMPCETFSTAGTTSRSFYDDRQFLFREGIRIAKMCKAKMILFENVPAITTKTVAENDSTLIIDVLKKELELAGYKNYIEVVLDASKFGVPQKRHRYFILATRYKNWELTPPQPSTDSAVSVKEAFAGLPNVEPKGEDKTEYTKDTSDYAKLMRDEKFWRREGMGSDVITEQHPMNHKESTIKRFSLIKAGEGLPSLFERYTGEERERLQKEGVMPAKSFSKRNHRLDETKPSQTVTSHCLEEFVHPHSNRCLTVRECARLQSFPDSYVFRGPYSVGHDNRQVQDKYEQIGDAVPPLLAYAWGKRISEILNKYLSK